ncbi:MAG: hypothetical protein AAFU54_00245 [Chloroflexota bacterium]
MKVTLATLLMALLMWAMPLHAQESVPLACGDNITGAFNGAETEFDYNIFLTSGSRMIVHIDALPVGSDASGFEVEIVDLNGFIIESVGFLPDERTVTTETGQLLREGVYDIEVSSTTPGAYQLFVSCVDASGTVVSDNNLVNGVQCGGEVENTFLRPDELHRYYLNLQTGDALTVNAFTLDGEFADMTIELGLYSPNNDEIDRVNDMFKAFERVLNTGPLSQTGTYRLYIRAFDDTNDDYRVTISCELASGQVIPNNRDTRIVLAPTVMDAAPITDFSAQAAPPPADSNPAPAVAPSPGNMPALLPSQLVSTIEIPLVMGIPGSGVITADFEGMYGFVVDAGMDNALRLDFARVSGNENIGVIVLSEVGAVVFQASITSGNTLSTDFIAPSSGTYTIGVYPLNIAPPFDPQPTAFTVTLSAQ